MIDLQSSVNSITTLKLKIQHLATEIAGIPFKNVDYNGICIAPCEPIMKKRVFTVSDR